MGTDLPTCRWVHVGTEIDGCWPMAIVAGLQATANTVWATWCRQGTDTGNIQWPHTTLFSRGIKCHRPGMLSAFYICSLQCVFLTPVADRNSYWVSVDMLSKLSPLLLPQNPAFGTGRWCKLLQWVRIQTACQLSFHALQTISCIFKRLTLR